jgi:hypothetical protein
MLPPPRQASLHHASERAVWITQSRVSGSSMPVLSGCDAANAHRERISGHTSQASHSDSSEFRCICFAPA